MLPRRISRVIISSRSAGDNEESFCKISDPPAASDGRDGMPVAGWINFVYARGPPNAPHFIFASAVASRSPFMSPTRAVCRILFCGVVWTWNTIWSPDPRYVTMSAACDSVSGTSLPNRTFIRSVARNVPPTGPTTNLPFSVMLRSSYAITVSRRALLPPSQASNLSPCFASSLYE